MAKRLLSHPITNSNANALKLSLLLGYTLIKKLHQIPIQEIQIPVQYGYIAGKLWGCGEERPLLALHGWQDNAGSWDALLPMIIKDRPVLAIDFPGHGLSSWIPPGMLYYQWELPRTILYIKQHFKWEKNSLIGHSMGAIAAMRFSSIFPSCVEYCIVFDSLIYEDYDLDSIANIIRKSLVAQTRLGKEPPSYTMEDITKIWHKRTNKSVALGSVTHLIKRGTKQSQINPNKYYFSRDARLKYILFTPEEKTFVESIIKRLMCPTLYIKAKDSPYSTDSVSGGDRVG